jgi:poly(3-hydroxybutyrate) depolymerase
MSSFLDRAWLASLVIACMAACKSSPAPTSTGPFGGPPTGTSDAGVLTGPTADAASTPGPVPGAKVTSEAIKVGGVTRTYVLVVPRTYQSPRRYPLVFAFHGSFGSGAQFRDFYKLERASAEDALVAYPDGVLDNKEWDLDSIPSKNADVALFDAVVADLAGRFSVDKARVFATGWSNGGFFANRLACSRSSAVKAISSLSGGAPYDVNNVLPRYKPDFVKCPDEGPVASMSIHGIDDPEVGLDSGEFSAIYWAFVNGCTGNRAPTTPAPCEAYACPPGKPVLFCPFPKIGHGIPPDAAELTWNFFKGIP